MTEREILKAAENYCNKKKCKECDYWKAGQGCRINYPGTKGDKKHA